ncbi:MAG: hypothetical protein Tsb0020_39880 [Haliangiales bacterium]
MSQDASEQEPARGTRLYVSLDSLYLDPNNYRFIDHDDYKPVADDELLDPAIQRRTTRFVLGYNQDNVRDLQASIKENGWLEVDPILVRRLERGAYLVVEGNRRVATLKYLKRRHDEDAIDLGKLDPAVFARVPVINFGDGDERRHLVLMGLHHIAGKRRWPAVNRALAMKRLREQLGGDSDAVCRALGVSKREYNLSIRTLALTDLYKASDFGDQFKTEQFNLFREVLKSPAIREWLGWDQDLHQAGNKRNLERLFSWMSRESGDDDDVVDDGVDTGIGAPTEPAITTGGHVRELAKLIEDEAALKRLDETRSLQEATISSDLLVKSEIEGALESCERDINRLNVRAGQLDQAALDRVEQFIGKLQGVALARKRRPQLAGSRQPWEPFNEVTQAQFSQLSIPAYRGVSGLTLSNLRRVNILVGTNNVGKTSVLEAVYLLTRQNDDRALIDLLTWRGRLEGEPDPAWLAEQLPAHARIEGTFDTLAKNRAVVELETTREPDDSVEDQAAFLAQLAIESQYADKSQSAVTTLFAERSRRTNFQGRHWLCRSVFTSPFSANRPATLARCNKDSVEHGTKERVLAFIRERIDSGVHNIEMVDKFSRFLVTHERFDKAPDLSSFGDGLRRVFELGLLMAGARGGVLIIDEFENALHTELLHDFTIFVQELAAELDVQVFLSTHSKETVDAFVLNDCRSEDIAGYALVRKDDTIMAHRYSGEDLIRLHEAIDFDMRVVQ